MQGHRIVTECGLTYCFRCGHVLLNNEVSRMITALGCDYEENERYRNWVRRHWPFETKVKGW